MRLAIMQPYFFPYIGYFQLIGAVDLFLLYDNIKYTKKGWINRNRILQDGKDVTFSLPLKNDSDALDIDQRELAVNFNRDKLLNRICATYRRAPHFPATFALVEQVIRYENTNLFNFLHNSIVKICEYLNIATEIRISSSINIDHSLKHEKKVLALCTAVGTSTYINSIGGLKIYSVENFLCQGFELKFIRPTLFTYKQFDKPFVPWLSIIDVMMFNSLHDTKNAIINHYEFV